MSRGPLLKHYRSTVFHHCFAQGLERTQCSQAWVVHCGLAPWMVLSLPQTPAGNLDQVCRVTSPLALVSRQHIEGVALRPHWGMAATNPLTFGTSDTSWLREFFRTSEPWRSTRDFLQHRSQIYPGLSTAQHLPCL